MNTHRLLTSVTRAAAAIALAMLFQSPQAEAAGKPSQQPRVEFKMTGPVFTLPDHTADADSDQCRENGLGGMQLVQRKTTMDLTALGLGIQRRIAVLDVGVKKAGPGRAVTFSFWLTSHCQILVNGVILAGQWPLPAGSPGTELVVIIPAFTPWISNKTGGGGEPCFVGGPLGADVYITIRRNDARTGDVCDCPFDYTDANGNMIADECE